MYLALPSSSLFLSILFLLTNLNQLVASYNLTSESYSELQQPNCQSVETPLCDIPGYMTVQPFNNSFGHTSLTEAIAELHKYGFLFQKEVCRTKIKLFLCSLYAPVCPTPSTILDKLLLPCRDDCEEARKNCLPSLQEVHDSWSQYWECERFNYHKDDKLCVMDTNQHQSLPPPPLLTPVTSVSSDIVTTSETKCAEDLFDCRLRDPTTNMQFLCIEKSFVCDGKKDCSINGTQDGQEGLDEANCGLGCPEEHVFCYDRCVSKKDLCIGKTDCESVLVDQHCSQKPELVENNITIVQLLIFIGVLSLVLALVILKITDVSCHRCKNYFDDDKKSEIAENSPHIEIVVNQQFYQSFIEPTDNSPPKPCTNSIAGIYQEYSSEYEVLNRGQSGNSSIYNGDPFSELEGRIPPAPPPTPAPYS